MSLELFNQTTENLLFLRYLVFTGIIIMVAWRIINFHKKLNEEEKTMTNLRCCFSKCKYKNESMINVFKHMQEEHKLKVGKNIFKEISQSGGKK